MSWIQDGLLEAGSETTRTGKTRYFVRHRPLEKFCLEHWDLLLTRRLSLERLAFIEQYVFAPKHASCFERARASASRRTMSFRKCGRATRRSDQ